MLKHVEICWHVLRYVETCWNQVETCWNMLTCVEICWNHVEIRLKSCWNHVEIMLKSCLGCFRSSDKVCATQRLACWPGGGPPGAPPWAAANIAATGSCWAPPPPPWNHQKPNMENMSKHSKTWHCLFKRAHTKVLPLALKDRNDRNACNLTGFCSWQQCLS